MHRVFVSIGSSIDRDRHIAIAVAYLRQQFEEVVLSPVYESEAVGFEGAAFFNLAAGFRTPLALEQLAAQFKQLEATHGRLPNTPKFSARTLDIDILTYDDWVGDYDGICLPRPEIIDNAFVLLPLQDIAGDILHPELGVSYRQLWREYDKGRQRLWPVTGSPQPAG